MASASQDAAMEMEMKLDPKENYSGTGLLNASITKEPTSSPPVSVELRSGLKMEFWKTIVRRYPGTNPKKVICLDQDFSNYDLSVGWI